MLQQFYLEKMLLFIGGGRDNYNNEYTTSSSFNLFLCTLNPWNDLNIL